MRLNFPIKAIEKDIQVEKYFLTRMFHVVFRMFTTAIIKPAKFRVQKGEGYLLIKSRN